VITEADHPGYMHVARRKVRVKAWTEPMLWDHRVARWEPLEKLLREAEMEVFMLLVPCAGQA
jgi:hypothetical protein